MVTSVHSIETWKQMEVVRRFEREGNQVWKVMMKLMSNDEVDKLKLNNNEVDKKKNAWEIRKELVFRGGSWLMHHLQNISHQKVYTFWHCVVNNEVPSTSSQIVEQIEVIQGVVLPGISKMNDSAPD